MNNFRAVAKERGRYTFAFFIDTQMQINDINNMEAARDITVPLCKFLIL